MVRFQFPDVPLWTIHPRDIADVAVRALQGSHDGEVLRLTGPVALSVETPEDELGWHEFDPLPAHAMRRRRRIDVYDGALDGLVHVDVFFRDSHMPEEGIEHAVHEYTLVATVDPQSMRFVTCEATPRVLPWVDCPDAAASAGRLAGMPVSGLRPEVRSRFVGPSTCTHLNDVLRGLEDVEWLVRELSAQ